MTFGRRSLILSLLLLIAACTGGTLGPGVADRGIGGTGISVGDRGIGGTGIVGTVTAFGSVWVNGLRVDLPRSTVVRIEGRAADTAAVRIGHLVAMTAAAGGPTGLEARTLDVRYAVAGPVERLEGAVATVMGQRIDVADAEGRDGLRPGAWVGVSGLRRADGSIDASRIDAWSDAGGWLLRGRLDAVSPTTLTVAGRTLSRTVSGTALPPVGSLVRVSGPGAVSTLALAVAPDPFNPFGATVGALSVETFVDDDGRVAGGEDGPVAGASEGRRVVIDSAVGSGGGLRDSRSFRAPSLGGTVAPGADPSARAVGLAREGMRRDGPVGNGTPGNGTPGGFGAPEGMGPGDMDRRDAPHGMGRGPDGSFGGPRGGGYGRTTGAGGREGARASPMGPGASEGGFRNGGLHGGGLHGGGPRGGGSPGHRGGMSGGGRGGGAGSDAR